MALINIYFYDTPLSLAKEINNNDIINLLLRKRNIDKKSD